jgi:glycosyltransferase involved in cell wall biosynthesis
MRLGYLLSEYPTPGHAFMDREVSRLEQLGADLVIVAIRPPAQANTRRAPQGGRSVLYVRLATPRQVLAAHARALSRHPLGWLRGLAHAFAVGAWHPRATAAALLYFVEAVVAGDWLVTRGVSHVHVHFSSTVALLASRVWPLGFSMTIHGPDEFDAQPEALLRRKVAASRFVIAISHFARSQIMRRSHPADWNKIEVVPLGVEPAALRPRPRAGSAPFRLVCAGRLAPVKGHRVLLDALRQLAAAGTGLGTPTLHLAGDGPERASLERRVREAGLQDHVVFEGLLDRDALVALYRRCDLFVLPTFAEGVPVVLMEAMALELPCVSTWVCGVPELIDAGRSGVLVPPGDADALAAAIAALMVDPDRRRELGRQGRAAVLARYDVDRNVRRLHDVFSRRIGVASDAPATAAGAAVRVAPTATPVP